MNFLAYKGDVTYSRTGSSLNRLGRIGVISNRQEYGFNISISLKCTAFFACEFACL
uniref:Uncharacterized protein n=1 Tax=Anguilla anguilla TaxID=7936 RepID=A0A0E9P5N7_ANGAN